MSDGPTRYASFGVCIYCGVTDVSLTDEHILPYSLFGVHVIERASCLNCAKITGRFEQDVARGLWGDFRAKYGAPTRRKAARPTQYVAGAPTGPSVTVPMAEYPAPGVFYRLPKAGILSGTSPELDTSAGWQVITLSDHAELKDFEKTHGVPATARFKHVPASFARMLAKIGYGQILTSLSPSEFDPLCIPYILGERTNPSYLVGGSLDDRPPEPVAYRMKTAAFGNADHMVLLAEIRLWAHLGAPDYHVVVGSVSGKARVASALGKLQLEGGQTVRRNAPEDELYLDKPWAPASWPPM